MLHPGQGTRRRFIGQLAGDSQMQLKRRNLSRRVRPSVEKTDVIRTTPAPLPTVPTWSAALREAKSYQRRLRFTAEPQSWHASLRKYTGGVFVGIALTTSLDLAEEAIAMRHCADRYAEECAQGKTVVYSLRDDVTHQRLATFCVQMKPRGAERADIKRSLNRTHPRKRSRSHSEPSTRSMNGYGLIDSRLSLGAKPRIHNQAKTSRGQARRVCPETNCANRDPSQQGPANEATS